MKYTIQYIVYVYSVQYMYMYCIILELEVLYTSTVCMILSYVVPKYLLGTTPPGAAVTRRAVRSLGYSRSTPAPHHDRTSMRIV